MGRIFEPMIPGLLPIELSRTGFCNNSLFVWSELFERKQKSCAKFFLSNLFRVNLDSTFRIRPLFRLIGS